MTAISSPGTMPLAGVSGRPSKSCCAAPVAMTTCPGRASLSRAPASPMDRTQRGRNTSQTNCAVMAAATLPTPATATTRPPPSHSDRRGPTVSERGMRATSACASCSRPAMTATGLRSGMRENALRPGHRAEPEQRTHGRPPPHADLVDRQRDRVAEDDENRELGPKPEVPGHDERSERNDDWVVDDVEREHRLARVLEGATRTRQPADAGVQHGQVPHPDVERPEKRQRDLLGEREPADRPHVEVDEREDGGEA